MCYASKRVQLQGRSEEAEVDVEREASNIRKACPHPNVVKLVAAYSRPELRGLEEGDDMAYFIFELCMTCLRKEILRMNGKACMVSGRGPPGVPEARVPEARAPGGGARPEAGVGPNLDNSARDAPDLVLRPTST